MWMGIEYSFRFIVSVSRSRGRTFEKKVRPWQLWDLNPRPFGPKRKSGTLDHSTKLSQRICLEKPRWSSISRPMFCQFSFLDGNVIYCWYQSHLSILETVGYGPTMLQLRHSDLSFLYGRYVLQIFFSWWECYLLLVSLCFRYATLIS